MNRQLLLGRQPLVLNTSAQFEELGTRGVGTPSAPAKCTAFCTMCSPSSGLIVPFAVGQAAVLDGNALAERGAVGKAT